MASSNPMKKYIIIDNDAGVDDSLAIMTALHLLKRKSNQEVEVLAITCAPGNSELDKVLTNVRITLEQYGKTDIPVYKGCWRSVSTLKEPGDHFGDDGLGNVAHKFSPSCTDCESEPAASLMIRLARQYPKQISFVCLAPLTNLAIAYLMDPEFLDFPEALYILGGDSDEEGNIVVKSEYNFTCDKKAAKLVLASAKCPLVLVQRPVSLAHTIGPDDYQRLISIKTKRGEYFKSVTDVRKNDVNGRGMRIADVLLVAGFLAPELVLEKETKTVKMKIEDDILGDAEGKTVDFIRKLDMQQVLDLLAEMLSDESA